MTDTDRQAVCWRIAEAMGWVHNPNRAYSWAHPVTGSVLTAPPDFFTDPKAADELMRWLDAKENDYIVSIRNYYMLNRSRQWRIEVQQKGVGRVGIAQYDDWKIALAEAADKAIKEAKSCGS